MPKQTRKRSLTKSNFEESNATTPKKTRESVSFISEIEFKFLLRDKETVNEGLEKFVQTAEAFTDGVPCPDIVGQFCNSSPNLAELWNLLDPPSCKLKINEIALVFECLEHILTRIRTDLFKLSSMGEGIVQKVLAVHMGQLYNCFRDINKSKTIKSGLKLLIAMVLLSDKSKKAILTRLNFGHQNFHPLFSRRNRKDPQDVRSCLVLLTLAFLLDSDSTVITFLVQQKTFLQSVIGGLMYDPKEVVIDTLATLLDKVVKCPGVSKTDKIKLFSEVSLKKICELLHWKGPSGWRAGQDKRDQDEEVEVLDDDRQVIADVVHDFLTELCCSHKHGINFYDKTLGIGNRNQNQLLTHFLEWLVKTIDDPHTSDLIISILSTCPDQIKIVLNNLCALLSSRWSEKWIKLMDWLAKLYSSLQKNLHFLAQKDTVKEADKIVSMAVIFCLPPLKVCVSLQQSVKHEDPRVRHTALKVISVLLLNANIVKKELLQILGGEQKSQLVETILDLYTATVLTMLPPLSQIFICVDKIMQKVEDEESIDLQERAAVTLQVLALYQQLSPSLISDKQKDLSNLIEIVGQVIDTFKTESVEDNTSADNETNRLEQPMLPQLYLLGLLSEIDAKTLYLGREKILLKLLSFASHCGQYRKLCVGLIGKMLQSVEVFSGHGKELSVWIETALKNTLNADFDNTVLGSNIIHFLANCLAALINNPAPYVDRLLEAANEYSLNDGQILESGIDGSENNTLDDILAMNQKELDDKLKVFQPTSFHIQKSELPLSPLILVALDNLNSDTKVDDNVKSYVNNVLAQLVYTVVSPQTLANLVCNHRVAIDGLIREYINYWHCKEIKPSKIKPLPVEMYGSCTNLLMSVFFCHLKTATDVNNIVGQLTKEIRSLDTFSKLNTLRLVIFFMSQTLERHSKEKLCHEVLKVLQEAAEVLIDDIANEENWISKDKQIELKHQHSSSSEMKEKKEHSESFVESQMVKVHNTPSDLFVTLHKSINTSKEDILQLLQNLTFKKFVFLKMGKSKKKKETLEMLACSLSRFVNKLLQKCTTWTWFSCEKETIQQWVSDLMTNLVVAAKSEQSELYIIYLEMITTLYPLLDLVTLSTCITQLLKLPVSLFFKKGKDESIDMIETHIFKVLCLMLQHWVHLLKADPNFTSASLFRQLTINVQAVKLLIQMKKRNMSLSNAIRTSYSVEESTMQSPSAFASMFDLLPHCQDSGFHNVVLFVVNYLPEVAHHFSTDIFNELLQMQLNVKNETDKEQIVSCLVENVSDCFKICDTWIHTNASLVFKKNKWNLINSYLAANNKFLCERDQAFVEIRKAAVRLLKSEKFTTATSKELLQVYKQLSVNLQFKDVHFQTLLTRAIQDSIKSHDTSDKQALFEVLVVSTKFSQQSEEESRKAASELVELALRHLLYLTSSKTSRHSDMENYILDLLPHLIDDNDFLSVSFLSSFWDKFVTNTLRCLFMNFKLLNLLCKLVPKVYSAGSNMNLSVTVQTLFHMCINHTAFMNVMMAPEHAKAKSELVYLLYLLGEHDPSLYVPGLSKALIGSYNATLSETDQRLLLMIKKCQKDADRKFDCPCLWGKKAVEYHNVSKVLGPSLDKEASVKSIIEQLNQQQMIKSMLHFPLRRKQKCTSIMDATEFKSKSTCYDPNFLLLLFAQILSPDKLVPLQLFVEQGCLSYLLVALSSHDVENRLVAYHALNDFYQHADGSRWLERTEINFLLDLLNSSRNKNGQKLPYVIALFFARVVKLLMHPADPLYMPIVKFLVAKPEIDLHSVPEFYQLFFSSTLQYKQERCWLLSLLSDGVRETSDYWIYQRKLIFKIIFSFYDSPLCDDKSQVLILQTMKNALKEKFIAVDLVKRHGLMAWLLGVVKSLSSHPQHIDVVCDLVHTLWNSLTTMRYNKPPACDSADLTRKDQTQKNVDMDEEDISETGMLSDEEEMEDDIKANKEGESERNCRNPNSEGKNTQKLFSASVPTSTRVEIGLVIKCLIWNLNNVSHESLLKLLEVIHSLLTNSSDSLKEYVDNTSMCEPQDLTKANISTSLNITSLETWMLLYHVANAVQLEKIAKSARDMLHKKGVTLDSCIRKVNRKPQNKVSKLNISKLQDGDELEDGQNDVDVPGDDFKLDSDSDLSTNFTIEKKQKLLFIIYRIARVTNTLSFI